LDHSRIAAEPDAISGLKGTWPNRLSSRRGTWLRLVDFMTWPFAVALITSTTHSSTPATSVLMKSLGFTIEARPIPFGVGTAAHRVIHRISKVDGVAFLNVDMMMVTSILQQVWNHRQHFMWRGRQVWVVSLAGLAQNSSWDKPTTVRLVKTLDWNRRPS
jgi:hypothetical protein